MLVGLHICSKVNGMGVCMVGLSLTAFPLRKGGNFGLFGVFYVSVYVGNSGIYSNALILSRPENTYCITKSYKKCYIFVGIYREFVLFSKQMLKNRNTVDVSSTKQRKQTIIMGLRSSALKNAKCLDRQRIFRYDRHTRGMNINI